MADFLQDDSEPQRGIPLPGADRKPFVTWTLLAANLIVWAATENAGGSQESQVLLDFGAMFGPLIADGEYWRLFTAMFLHVGLRHLLFNSFGLFIFGRIVERIYGHLPFAVIYVVAGLAGSVASYLLNPIAVGAGASGAILGVLGAVAAFFMARRDLLGEMGRQTLSGILVIAAIILFYGFVTPGIDNWAHIGGFVTGLAVGLALAPRYRAAVDPFGTGLRHLVDHSSFARAWWVVPAAGAVLSAGAWLGTATLPDNPLTHIYRAERLVEREAYGEALDEVARSIRLDSTNGQAYYVRGKILAELGDTARARRDLYWAIDRARETRDLETQSRARELLNSLGPGFRR